MEKGPARSGSPSDRYGRERQAARDPWRHRIAPVLVCSFVALFPFAAASPPDPTWIAGLYDEGDYDDVVGLATSDTAAAELPTSTEIRPTTLFGERRDSDHRLIRSSQTQSFRFAPHRPPDSLHGSLRGRLTRLRPSSSATATSLSSRRPPSRSSVLSWFGTKSSAGPVDEPFAKRAQWYA